MASTDKALPPAAMVIAPALRGLLGVPERLKLVAFDAGPAGAGRRASGVLRLPEPPDGDAHAVVAWLRGRLGEHRGGVPGAIEVQGVGLFTAREPEPQSGRVAGKVALVTGAARGFGLEIARDFVAQGGYAALADVDAAGAARAAGELAAEHGADHAIGLDVDVSDSASVAHALEALVCAYGGLDVLISNAGVLRAAGVREMREADFDLVTAVNYRGYFLCVKHAAPVMAVQHTACPGYVSDVIQINSKSGLEGSSRNAAYAGGKHGGIGLTQSFALELMEDGIKVNAVCPGNYFDGPLWSDPENGLFVQYLRAGKVEGARTVEDVRRAYEAKIPMGRGCTPGDVCKAIYYLIEQRYETGQALPVTGGQVMLP